MITQKKMIKNNSLTSFLIIIYLLYSGVVQADNKKLSLPRFVSIKSNEVNARTGPHFKSSIEWIFIKKGEPVEIIEEYEQWRLVRDHKGEGGWIHASVLSAKRFIVVISKDIVPMLASPDNKNKIIVKLAPNVRCQLHKAIKNWCKIQCREYKGWLQKEFLWGVYTDEKL